MLSAMLFTKIDHSLSRVASCFSLKRKRRITRANVRRESSSEGAYASVQLFREACSSFHHRRPNVAMQYCGETERTPGCVCRSALRIPRQGARLQMRLETTSGTENSASESRAINVMQGSPGDAIRCDAFRAPSNV